MRILHICDWHRPFGGAERLLFSMLKTLEAGGHENILVANDAPGQMRTGKRPEYFVERLEADFADVPLASLGGSAPWIDRLRTRLAEIIARHKPDVAHFHNMQNPFVLRAVAEDLPSVRSIHDPRLYCPTDWRLLPNGDVCPHAMGRRCVTEGCLPRNPLGSSSLIKRLPYRLLHFKEHRRLETLIAESRAVYDCLRQNGFPAEQIAILPNMTASYGDWDEVCRFNERHHRSEDRVVLFVGRASREKGIDQLIDAMALVPKPWKLVLVTGGDYLRQVKERIKARGIENSVELPGVLDYETTRAQYARADVVAFPSVWIESFGLVGVEAMANGKPVVAFKTGGIPDWLDDGRTGLLAPLKDVSALARNIERLLGDPTLARAMGRSGHERAARLYNEKIYLDRLIGIYGAAIGRRRGHAGVVAAEGAVPLAV